MNSSAVESVHCCIAVALGEPTLGRTASPGSIRPVSTRIRLIASEPVSPRKLEEIGIRHLSFDTHIAISTGGES